MSLPNEKPSVIYKICLKDLRSPLNTEKISRYFHGRYPRDFIKFEMKPGKQNEPLPSCGFIDFRTQQTPRALISNGPFLDIDGTIVSVLPADNRVIQIKMRRPIDFPFSLEQIQMELSDLISTIVGDRFCFDTDEYHGVVYIVFLERSDAEAVHSMLKKPPISNKFDVQWMRLRDRMLHTKLDISFTHENVFSPLDPSVPLISRLTDTHTEMFKPFCRFFEEKYCNEQIYLISVQPKLELRLCRNNQFTGKAQLSFPQTKQGEQAAKACLQHFLQHPELLQVSFGVPSLPIKVVMQFTTPLTLFEPGPPPQTIIYKPELTFSPHHPHHLPQFSVGPIQHQPQLTHLSIPLPKVYPPKTNPSQIVQKSAKPNHSRSDATPFILNKDASVFVPTWLQKKNPPSAKDPEPKPESFLLSPPNPTHPPIGNAIVSLAATDPHSDHTRKPDLDDLSSPDPQPTHSGQPIQAPAFKSPTKIFEEDLWNDHQLFPAKSLDISDSELRFVSQFEDAVFFRSPQILAPQPSGLPDVYAFSEFSFQTQIQQPFSIFEDHFTVPVPLDNVPSG
ncbi:hypothetical protein BLNAU_17078 [Blattamonas nauphoetae]|uniref:RRM domain-containing protein n=1 Tax=Blattamonas nauphoetae TaxID=2049346 RepID=A0ABQ9X989_9EUKA|nr:hypothetical protein BLNAU_17078 [Blattamonas nauphoetae]